MDVQLNQKPNKKIRTFALFNLGFRPFFLGASLFAILSMVAWVAVLFSHSPISIENIHPSQWHAHEMLYGYGLAVVAGFLLTAVKNWTGIATIHGVPLLILFLLWLVARVCFLFGTTFMLPAAVADLSFGLMLVIAISIPIIRAKQWKQFVVISKVMLLVAGNLIFYLGCFGLLSKGVQYGIYGALLLLISLILVIGRRVIPFFIEKGVGAKIQLKQIKWLDSSILIAYVALFVNAVFIQAPLYTRLLAWSLFILNGYRLTNWHTSGIWRIPLLWSLYLSAWFINLGFLLFGFQVNTAIVPVLTLHLFAIGGIGFMTIGMMARVALGHTGRDIKKPSPLISFAFLCIVASVICRVFLPMISGQLNFISILCSAIFWIVSFTIFAIVYTPILTKPRADGAAG